MQLISILQLSTLASKLDIPLASVVKYTEEVIAENKLADCILLKDQAMVIKVKPSLVKFIEDSVTSINDLSNILKLERNIVQILLEYIKKENFAHFYYSKDREKIIGEKALLKRILQVLEKNNFIVDLSKIFKDIAISSKDISELIVEAINIYDKNIFVKIKGTKLLLAGNKVRQSIYSYVKEKLENRDTIHVKEFSEFKDFKPLMSIIEEVLATEGYIKCGDRYTKYEVVLDVLRKELQERGVVYLDIFSEKRGIDLARLGSLLETTHVGDNVIYLKQDRVLIHKQIFCEKIKQYIRPYSKVSLKAIAEEFSLSKESIEEILLEFIRENMINARLDPIEGYLINLDVVQASAEARSILVDISKINYLESKVRKLIEKVEAW